MRLDIDVDEMELGEVEFFEEQSGFSLEELQAGHRNTKALLALITIIERRKNPQFTMDDARKIKVGEIEADPTPAPNRAARRAKPKAAS